MLKLPVCFLNLLALRAALSCENLKFLRCRVTPDLKVLKGCIYSRFLRKPYVLKAFLTEIIVLFVFKLPSNFLTSEEARSRLLVLRPIVIDCSAYLTAACQSRMKV